MTLSEIRRRIEARRRRFAPRAIIKLHRIAEACSDEWDPSGLPETGDVIRRIAEACFRLPTFTRLSRYLNDVRRQGDVPESVSIVLDLLPWVGRERYRELLRRNLPAPAL